MTESTRIRLSRARGFDLQAYSRSVNGLPAVNVARPGPWGNPFVVGQHGSREECVKTFALVLAGNVCLTASPAIKAQNDTRAFVAANIATLAGKNLACWCALDGKPCHADVLLQIANKQGAAVFETKCEEVG